MRLIQTLPAKTVEPIRLVLIESIGSSRASEVADLALHAVNEALRQVDTISERSNDRILVFHAALQMLHEASGMITERINEGARNARNDRP